MYWRNQAGALCRIVRDDPIASLDAAGGLPFAGDDCRPRLFVLRLGGGRFSPRLAILGKPVRLRSQPLGVPGGKAALSAA